MILLAYAHVVVQLDAKAFWWDESLSLQRAEQPLLDILRGVLWIRDGFSSLLTIDQHPFFSFLLQGALIRTAGESEFVVRYGGGDGGDPVGAVAVGTGTLACCAAMLRRRQRPGWLCCWAPSAPSCSGTGRRRAPMRCGRRWPCLPPTWRCGRRKTRRLDGRFAVGFVVAEAIFLTTHYYAVLLLPVHALILFAWLARRNFVRALIAGRRAAGRGQPGRAPTAPIRSLRRAAGRISLPSRWRCSCPTCSTPSASA